MRSGIEIEILNPCRRLSLSRKEKKEKDSFRMKSLRNSKKLSSKKLKFLSFSPKRLQSGLRNIGSIFSKVNIGRWDNGLECSQDSYDLANNSERFRVEICQQAEALCIQAVYDHLTLFLEKHPFSSYEEWIADLHPENVNRNGTIDHRFYMEGSDHRKIWNKHLKTESGTELRDGVETVSYKENDDICSREIEMR